jgi:hypothetical protein
MKSYLITAFFCLNFFWSFAQTRKYDPSFAQKSWIGMSAGLAVPIGDFKDDDLNNYSAGFAKAGFTGKLDFGIKIFQNMGICFTGTAGLNGFNTDPIKTILHSGSSAKVEVNAGSWKYVGGLGGFYMFTPIKTGALMLKGQLGYASATSPSLDILVSSGNSFVKSSQTSGTAGALLLDFGLNGVIPLNEMVFLNLGVDYMSTSPEFTNISVSSTSSFGPPEYANISYKMEMRWVNISVGILKQF